VLDAAITRPCRFDRKIEIGYPTNESLAKMFTQRTGLKPPDNSFDQDNVPDDKKLTGAHIEEICNTAELLAADKGCTSEECVEEAVEIIRKNFFMATPGSTTGFSSGASKEAGTGSSKSSSVPTLFSPTDKDFYSN